VRAAIIARKLAAVGRFIRQIELYGRTPQSAPVSLQPNTRLPARELQYMLAPCGLSHRFHEDHVGERFAPNYFLNPTTNAITAMTDARNETAREPKSFHSSILTKNKKVSPSARNEGSLHRFQLSTFTDSHRAKMLAKTRSPETARTPLPGSRPESQKTETVKTAMALPMAENATSGRSISS
jgi:hypothetical protein